jgi:hypothetical protein
MIIGAWSFYQCTSLGVGEDLDLDLDVTSVSVGSFNNTGYRTVTLHETTEHSIADYSGSGQYDAFARMPNLIKLDMSDTK